MSTSKPVNIIGKLPLSAEFRMILYFGGGEEGFSLQLEPPFSTNVPQSKKLQLSCKSIFFHRTFFKTKFHTYTFIENSKTDGSTPLKSLIWQSDYFVTGFYGDGGAT